MYCREPVRHAPHPQMGSCLLHGRPARRVAVSAPAASAGWWCPGQGCGLHIVCGAGPGVKIGAETGAGVETTVRLGASAIAAFRPCGSAAKPVGGGFSAELSLYVSHRKCSRIMAVFGDTLPFTIGTKLLTVPPSRLEWSAASLSANRAGSGPRSVVPLSWTVALDIMRRCSMGI